MGAASARLGHRQCSGAGQRSKFSAEPLPPSHSPPLCKSGDRLGRFRLPDEYRQGCRGVRPAERWTSGGSDCQPWPNPKKWRDGEHHGKPAACRPVHREPPRWGNRCDKCRYRNGRTGEWVHPGTHPRAASGLYPRAITMKPTTQHRRQHMQQWIHLTIGATLFITAFTSANAQVASPDGRNVVEVSVHEGGLYYSLKRDRKDLLRPSRLGFAFSGAPNLRDSLRIVNTAKRSFDSTWTQPWG